MKSILVVAAFFLVASAAVAAPLPRAVSASNVHVRVPAGWYSAVSKTTDCDPERLIVASSGPIRFRAGGQLAAPTAGHVLVLVLEARLAQDRGPAASQAKLSTWDRLVKVQGCAGPNAPAFFRFVRLRGRFVRFIVYPAKRVEAAARAQTLFLIKSLRVSGRR